MLRRADDARSACGRRFDNVALVILRPAVLLWFRSKHEGPCANHRTTLDRNQTRLRIDVQRDRSF